MGKKNKKKAPSIDVIETIDKLNLSGLLNVLDGVVDSPGRIVVMTTNHPEKLDAALIRPGRINKQIHLGPVGAAALCDMVEHYLALKLSVTERERLGALSRNHVFSPAQLEQYCADCDGLEDLFE